VNGDYVRTVLRMTGTVDAELRALEDKVRERIARTVAEGGLPPPPARPAIDDPAVAAILVQTTRPIRDVTRGVRADMLLFDCFYDMLRRRVSDWLASEAYLHAVGGSACQGDPS